MKFLISISNLFLFFSNMLFGQNQNISDNQKVILSFKTEQGNFIGLYEDKTNHIITFKQATEQNIAWQYPENNDTKELSFTYSYYLRGGANANEGMDLNYVWFVHKDVKYVLYETSHYGDLRNKIGLKTIDLKSAKTEDFKAINGSITGTLISLRDNEFVIKSNELFD